MLLLFAVTFGISTGLNPEGISHLSHVGGALYGVLAAAAWMPKQFPPAWRATVTILGVAGLIFTTLALLLHFYRSVFPGICCGC